MLETGGRSVPGKREKKGHFNPPGEKGRRVFHPQNRGKGRQNIHPSQREERPNRSFDRRSQYRFLQKKEEEKGLLPCELERNRGKYTN